MVDFPKGSKNEAIVNQYKVAKGSEQYNIIKGASEVALDLVLKARDSGKVFDYTSFRESSNKYSNSLDTLESNLKVISDFKSQFAKKGISTNDIPNIEKYGNEKVQSQNKSMESDILNRKPGYMNKDGSYSQSSSTEFKPSLTPNVHRSTSSGKTR